MLEVRQAAMSVDGAVEPPSEVGAEEGDLSFLDFLSFLSFFFFFLVGDSSSGSAAAAAVTFSSSSSAFLFLGLLLGLSSAP